MTSPTSIERHFAVSGPARLTLRNVSGAIDIEGGDGATLTVTAVKHPGRGFDHTEIDMEQAADGAVRVATRFEADLFSRLLGGGHAPCRVDYTVRLPRHAALDLAYVSGPARVAHLRGELKLDSVEGPLDLSDLGGTVRVKTVSGEVHATRLNLDGPLHLDSVSADVYIGASHLPGGRIATVSGALRLESGLAHGAYELHTVSGDMALYLPAGTRGTVQMNSLSGHLLSDLPGRPRHGGADEAGVTVRVSSVSGDVTISASGDSAAAAPPAPPAPAAEDRLALLDRIARGELSVDDALKDLNT